MPDTPGLPYPADEHAPVLWAPRLIGCSCGWRPKAPTPMGDDKLTLYKSHRTRKRGYGNDWEACPIVYGYGPDLGKPV